MKVPTALRAQILRTAGPARSLLGVPRPIASKETCRRWVRAQRRVVCVRVRLCEHRSRGPPACPRLPSGPGSSPLAAWMWRGCGGTLHTCPKPAALALAVQVRRGARWPTAHSLHSGCSTSSVYRPPSSSPAACSSS
eukprot:scaffold20416_cov35-Phaeocystis_antarctica.AAC.1